jgi:hypothetical protein
MEEGALALDPHKLWDDSALECRAPMSRTRVQTSSVQAVSRPVTVRAVPASAANRRRRARRSREARAAARRTRRIGALVLATAALLVTLLLTAFGSDSPPSVQSTAPAPATRLLPAGPPRPQVIAVRGALRIQMPVAQSRLTAIGYHASSGGALALSPVGRQANAGLFARLARRLLGTGGGGLGYYLLGGEDGPATSVLNVGAPPGTDVYSPVDGTIVGITDYVISGRRRGARIDIQPSGAASIVVSLTHLRPDPALTVGSTVAAASSKVGTLLDLADVERQALARYTNDAGNHVALEVHPSATLSS